MELENVNPEFTPDVQTEPVEASKPQERDWAAEAASMGWNKDYDGDDRIDAREFVLRKPIFDEQKKLKKKVRELETAIRTQTQMQEALLHKEREDLLRQFKEAKVEAIRQGDAERVIELEDEIDKVKATPIPKPNQPPPEFTAWVEDNSWYMDNPKLRRYADAYGLELYQQNPHRPLTEIYAEISREVRTEFKDEFKNTKRTTPSPVESGTRSAAVVHNDEPEIPKEYKQVFHTMWRAGAWGDLSQKEAAKKYAADLARLD